MKKIDKPAINQVEPFQEACNNKKLRKTYPNLVRFSTRAERLASFYDSSGGNPNEVKGGHLSVVEKKAMLDLYDDPPVGMSYISDLRSSLAGETCPMCGGENPTTLDHYLTKKKYPEYALLPYNLVPACSCNQRRKESLFDENTGARILHPYYDSCLMRPLISIQFEPDEIAPKLSVDYLLDISHPSYLNLKFHVENIILKTNFTSFFSKNWIKVRDRPNDILANYSKSMTTAMDFNKYLEGKHQTAFCGMGPNSWNAIFFRSILRRNISDWLFSRYQSRQ